MRTSASGTKSTVHFVLRPIRRLMSLRGTGAEVGVMAAGLRPAAGSLFFKNGAGEGGGVNMAEDLPEESRGGTG